MAVYIIDDHIEHAKMMERIVTEYLDDKEDIFTYTRQQDLLDGIRESVSLNIYFLDIQMREVDKAGFLLAQEIRQRDPEALLVFFTTQASYLHISYDYLVEPLNFIDKNLPEEEFKKKVHHSLDVYLDRSKKHIIDEDMLTFKTKFKKIYLPLSAINYIETSGSHQLIIDSTDGRRKLSNTMKELEDLHPMLIRIHRSFMINFEKLKELDRTNRIVTLETGDELPVSRSYYKDLLSLINEEW